VTLFEGIIIFLFGILFLILAGKDWDSPKARRRLGIKLGNVWINHDLVYRRYGKEWRGSDHKTISDAKFRAWLTRYELI